MQDWHCLDSDQMWNKVGARISLMAGASKKGKGKRVAVSGEEPLPEHSLVVHSQAVLSLDESLSATEMIAKSAINLEAVRFRGSFLPEKTLWHTSELCRRFVSNCKTSSLRSVKRKDISSTSNERTITRNPRIISPKSMESLAQLISKFSDSLTELRIPLSAPVCQATAQCHRLTKLIFDTGPIRDTEAEQSVVAMLAGKSRLKTLKLTGDRSRSEVIAEAILATNARLDSFKYDGLFEFSLSDFYWPRVQHLANHPLKTVRILRSSTGLFRQLSPLLMVFPQLRVFAGVMHISVRNWETARDDLKFISEYLDFYSAADGEMQHQLTIYRSSRSRAIRIEYLQEMADESTKPVNSVVVTQLDQEMPRVIFRRGKAVFCVVVTK